MFRSADEIQKNNEIYSEYARNAKARGEYDVAQYYKNQIRLMPVRELTDEEIQKNNQMYREYARHEFK